ncbi:unnamed protein product [marine sediment metagenome]|uniref:Helix-turn-helix type 11 domain-containing protein n=1 Tax=marine sediment metagenome TaxID=412755 RepID=X1T4H6_9ZZZZ
MAKSGEGMIGKSEFRNMIKETKAIESTSGKIPIIYQIWDLLKRNAVTRETMAKNLDVGERTITNAIDHLKQRKNLDIRRYFNKGDKKFYYYLKGKL